jgi:hypothetical protein
MTDGLVYLYAIGDAALASALVVGLVGVGGAPVRVLVSGRLAAVVSSVDPVRFREESLRRSLEDLSWVAATARAHHRVVDALWRDHPIAPLRLATVYLDDDNVRALLEAQEGAFAATLDRIRDREEWSVKAFAAPGSDLEPDENGGDSGRGPGADYLRRRRAARDRASRARHAAYQAAEDLHRTLAAAASASYRYPPQDPRLSGHPADMVLNAAYLVEATRSTSLRSAVHDWQSPLLQVTLTGPWAPYSFASLEEQP